MNTVLVLQVETGGGSVYVAGVTEGALRVVSHGGNAAFGKIRSATATVITGGGTVKADVLSAMLDLDSGGGACRVKRIVGGQLHITTGELDVDVLYGDHVNIACKSARIEQMQIGVQAKVRAYDPIGLGICVGGLDGSAGFETTGGDVELQLQERTKYVEVASNGGGVVLRVPEAMSGGIHLSAQAAGGIQILPPLVLEGSTDGATSASGALGGISEEGSGHRLLVAEREADDRKTCSVVISASSGSLKISQRSWFESKFGKMAFSQK